MTEPRPDKTSLLLQILGGKGREKDFPNADLSDADLSFQDLRGIGFPGAILTKVNFHNSMLAGANFSAADLSSAYLVSATLRNANFTSAKLIRADFNSADLTGANFTGVDLTGASFAGADITGIKIDSHYLANLGLDLSDTRMSADLRREIRKINPECLTAVSASTLIKKRKAKEDRTP